MGLDITIHKIKKYKNKVNDDNFFRLIDDNGNYNSLNFPEWALNFKIKIKEPWYDWKKFGNNIGVDFEDLEWYGEEFSERGNFISFRNKKTNEINEYKYDTIPTFVKEVFIVSYDNVGYQRGGLNNSFYNDYRGKKISYFVWSKKKLENYKDDYCTSDEDKINFQKNIIDKFEENKCCVTFDW